MVELAQLASEYMLAGSVAPRATIGHRPPVTLACGACEHTVLPAGWEWGHLPPALIWHQLVSPGHGTSAKASHQPQVLPTAALKGGNSVEVFVHAGHSLRLLQCSKVVAVCAAAAPGCAREASWCMEHA